MQRDRYTNWFPMPPSKLTMCKPQSLSFGDVGSHSPLVSKFRQTREQNQLNVFIGDGTGCGHSCSSQETGELQNSIPLAPVHRTTNSSLPLPSARHTKPLGLDFLGRSMQISGSSWSMTLAYGSSYCLGERIYLRYQKVFPSPGVLNHRNTGTRCPEPAGNAPCPKRLASPLSLSQEDSLKGVPPRAQPGSSGRE